MKKTSIALALGLMASGSAFANTFVNGGFENGDLSGWTGSGGCWGGGSFFGYSCGTPPPVPYTGAPLPVNSNLFTNAANNTVVAAGGFDPISGDALVYGGNFAARVNDSTNNYGVSVLKQSVTNYTDNDIFFEWNAVLESSHGLTDSDYFALVLHDDTTNTDVVTRSFSSASAPGTFNPCANASGWYCSGWQVEHIDVAALGALGHDFTLTLLASDCPYGGHAGYTYLDGFAAVIIPPGRTPEPATLALLGLGLTGLGFMRRKQRA